MDDGKGAAAGAAPRVSIVVPAHGCRELTAACLASIARHTPVPHEVLLVDDASEGEAAAAFRRLAGGTVRLLRNEQRRSYAVNNNLAAAAARGGHLCLLNNDTLVTPGWLEALLAVAERETGLGVLGTKQLFPDRPGLHHAGIAFDARGFPVHLHPHTDPAAPAVNYQRDVPAVTFACVLIPAAVYRALGGLEEAYRNGFEDVDFCLRARQEGLRVVYTPASLVYHYGQSSPGRAENDEANWRLFRERWPGRERGSLERITREDRALNRKAARRPRLRPAPAEGLHLAVDFAAGNAFAWATVSLVEALLARGERVAVSVDRCPRISPTIPRPQRRLLRSLMRGGARGTWQVKWSHYWRGHLRRELSGGVNAELFCTNFRGGAGVRAADPWLRNVQVNGCFKLPVSRFNLEALGDLGVPERDCAVVPLGYAPEIDRLFPGPPRRAPAGGDRRLLLVTNSHDLLRYGTDLAVRALGEAFGPGDPVVVHVRDYGASSGSGRLREWIGAQARFPRTVWHDGFLPKEELLGLYAGMDALLAPFRGEGFSMKVLDAMALGVPVFMPSFGGPTEYAPPGTFLEIPWRRSPVGDCLDRTNWCLGDEAWWCEPEAEALVDALRAWAADDAPARRAGEAAAAHVRGRYTWAQTAERLLDALRGWTARREVVSAVRRQPDRLPLSVVVPTKGRAGELAATLGAYAGQTLPAAAYELILVADHGDRGGLEAVAAPFADRLPLVLVGNTGPEGASSAGNEGIGRARGEVVLLAGDDLVPSPGLLEAHLEGHRRFPRIEEGLVGLVEGHAGPRSAVLPDPLAGAWGRPRNSRDPRDGERVTPDRCTAANCSFKRAFLAEEPGPLCAGLPLGPYAGIELALRLGLRGLELRCAARAVGRLDGETGAEGRLGRRRRAGRLVARLALRHPGCVPDEHREFVVAAACALRGLPPEARPGLPPAPDALLAHLEAEGAAEAREAADLIALRIGMAEELGLTEGDRAFLAAWAAAGPPPGRRARGGALRRAVARLIGRR